MIRNAIADSTHDPTLRCRVPSANSDQTDFPIQNLPLGVFRAHPDDTPRGGIAIGDQILDLAVVASRGWLQGEASAAAHAAARESLNTLLSLDPGMWQALRQALSLLLRVGSAPANIADALVEQSQAKMLLPVAVGDFTDFFASYEHALNAGSLFRPQLPVYPNFAHLPVAYHSRSSSIRVSPTPCIRPWGQILPSAEEIPVFQPTRALDYELELGAYIGGSGTPLRRIRLADAPAHLFGYCLLNDWSARDIQRWEAQPLGPFLAKNFLTTVSPWIVTQAALAPFRSPARVRRRQDPALLGYLSDHDDAAAGGLDIRVQASITTAAMRDQGLPPMPVSRGNSSTLYWTFAQMLAHHSSNGCPIRSGDLFGSGTISSQERRSSGCLLEVTANGAEPLVLPSGETRTYLQDLDEVIFTARCERVGFRSIGLGECRALVQPAAASQYAP